MRSSEVHLTERGAMLRAHTSDRASWDAQREELQRAHREQLGRLREALAEAREEGTATRAELRAEAGRRRMVEEALTRAQAKESLRIKGEREAALGAAKEELRGVVRATRPVLWGEGGLWGEAGQGRRVGWKQTGADAEHYDQPTPLRVGGRAA